jgi:hypothetical protein
LSKFKLSSGFRYSQLKKRQEVANKLKSSIKETYPSERAANPRSLTPKRKDGIPNSQMLFLSLIRLMGLMVCHNASIIFMFMNAVPNQFQG